jgi:hypothetical protein
LDDFEEESLDIQIDNLKVINNNVSDQPISYKYDFNINEGAEIVSEKLFLEPLLYLFSSYSALSQDERLYPLDFGFPYTERKSILFTIPDGYKVESLPESKLLTAEGKVSLNFSCKQINNQIQVTLNFDVNQGLIDVEYYDSIKELIFQIINVEESKIVLTKT